MGAGGSVVVKDKRPLLSQEVQTDPWTPETPTVAQEEQVRIILHSYTVVCGSSHPIGCAWFDFWVMTTHCDLSLPES